MTKTMTAEMEALFGKKPEFANSKSLFLKLHCVKNSLSEKTQNVLPNSKQNFGSPTH